jgi:hypothetical protein
MNTQQYPEFITCTACHNANHANRANCRYCGAKLERESAAGTVSPVDSASKPLAKGDVVDGLTVSHFVDGVPVLVGVQPDTRITEALASMRWAALALDIPAERECSYNDAIRGLEAIAKPNPFTNVPIAPEAPTPESLAKIIAAVLEMPRTAQAAFLTKVDDYAGAHYTGSKEQVISEVTTLIYDAEMFQDSLEPVRESTPATVPAADPEGSARCPICPECSENLTTIKERMQCPGCGLLFPADDEIDAADTTPSASEEQERWR